MSKNLEKKDMSIVQNISTNEIVIFHHDSPIYQMKAKFLLKKDELEQVIDYFRTAQFDALAAYR